MAQPGAAGSPWGRGWFRFARLCVSQPPGPQRLLSGCLSPRPEDAGSAQSGPSLLFLLTANTANTRITGEEVPTVTGPWGSLGRERGRLRKVRSDLSLDLSLAWEAEKRGLLAQVLERTPGKSPPHPVLVTLGWGRRGPQFRGAHLQAQQDWAAAPPAPAPSRALVLRVAPRAHLPIESESAALNPHPPGPRPWGQPANLPVLSLFNVSQPPPLCPLPGSAHPASSLSPWAPLQGLTTPGADPAALLLLGASGLSRPSGDSQPLPGGPA